MKISYLESGIFFTSYGFLKIQKNREGTKFTYFAPNIARTPSMDTTNFEGIPLRMTKSALLTNVALQKNFGKKFKMVERQ